MDNCSQFKGVYLVSPKKKKTKGSTFTIGCMPLWGDFSKLKTDQSVFWQPTSRMAEPLSQTITKDGLMIFLEIKAPR